MAARRTRLQEHASQVARHQSNAQKGAAALEARAQEIRRYLADGHLAMAQGCATNMATDVALLVSSISALVVLEDMKYLAEEG